MTLKLELVIAMRYLRSKSKESFISIVSLFSFLGIMLGVATLIIVMSVMNGFHIELLKNVLGMQGHITLHNYQGKFYGYADLANKLRLLPNIDYVSPIAIGEGLAVGHSKKSQGVIIKGILQEDLANKELLKSNLSEKAIADFNNGILIGNALAAKLGVAVGDDLKLLIPQTSDTILGMIPRSKTYKVVDIFDVGLYQYNATTIFMPLTAAQTLLKYEQYVSEIEIGLKSLNLMSQTMSQLNLYLPKGVKALDWQDYHNPLMHSLAVERVVMFIILTLIIVVAAFNIISGLIMLVKDKTRNIAILRAMGMQEASIVRIFIIAGSTIGILGTALGVVLGVLFAENIEGVRLFLEGLTGYQLFDPVIYYLSKLPVNLDVYNVIGIAVMSIILSVLATIYPAIRAARLSIAQVLRIE